MRAIIYTRQSLDRTGEGLAVARQLEDCQALVRDRGWTLVGTPSDNDRSAAGKTERPGFEELLNVLERGEADVVVAWALDRLTRNRLDQLRLYEVAEQRNVSLSFVRGGDVDVASSQGGFWADLFASLARHEIKQKSERQKRAQQQAAAQGRPAGGRRAFGYAANGVDVIETEAALIRQAYADVLAGGTLKGIARRWNESGHTTTVGNPWRHDNVKGVLLNKRYAGLRTHRGKVVTRAVWSPLVEEETQAAVAAILTMPERRTTTTVARKYLLPALALCGKCGSDVATGHTRHGKRVYVCRAKKCISRKADPVDALVEALAVKRLSQLDIASLIAEPDRARHDDLRRKAEFIRERLDDLAVGLAEGILTLPSVRQASSGLQAELADVEAEMVQGVQVEALRPMMGVRDVAAAWERAELAQKRAIIDAMMTVTLHSPERGQRAFDPATVHVAWRTD